MAHIEKRVTKKGVVRWRAQIRRLGLPDLNKTFRTKAHAEQWARAIEGGFEAPAVGKHTLLQAMRRYATEVSPTKRGARWERLRLMALEEDDIAKAALAAIDSDRWGKWRDARLLEVAPGTVRREMNLLQALYEAARREWKWVRVNPFRDVRKPQEPAARRRGVSSDDFAKMAEKLTGPAALEVLAGFELGIETGMRAGEMWGLEREQIDLEAGVARLTLTKNGDARDVALSPRAVEIMRGLLKDGRPALFTITNASRDALFRKARAAAGILDLHFHDSRSEAVIRLSKKLDVLELAQQIGHRDLNSLQLYYRQSAAERARRLGEPQTKPSPQKRPTAASRRPRGSASGSRRAS